MELEFCCGGDIITEGFKKRDTKTFALKRQSGWPPYIIKHILHLHYTHICLFFLCMHFLVVVYIYMLYKHLHYDSVELHDIAIFFRSKMVK